jgi:hypothetical protein
MALPSCDPEYLADAATCYRCLTGTNAEAVKIYLLAVIAGLDTMTADELIEAARCYNQCIPSGMQKSVQTYLLCQINTA